MNNELQLFTNSEFGELNIMEIDGKPYFPASDCARILGYSNPWDAIKRHCKLEGVVKHEGVSITTNQYGKSTEQSVMTTYINEGNLYRLIVKSKLPSAERFEKWVFDEILPSIRKNGGYIANQENMTSEQVLANAVLVAQRVIDSQNKQLAEMKPHAILGQAITTANTSILVGDMAKILHQNGIKNMGSKRLFQWLRDNGYLIKRKGSDWNMPTQKSIENGLFEIKESVHIDGNGCNIITKTPKISGKGQQYFVNKFLQNQNSVSIM